MLPWCHNSDVENASFLCTVNKLKIYHLPYITMDRVYSMLLLSLCLSSVQLVISRQWIAPIGMKFSTMVSQHLPCISHVEKGVSPN